jgi:hypothetical protein
MHNVPRAIWLCFEKTDDPALFVSMRVHTWPVHSSRSPCTKMHNGPRAIGFVSKKQTALALFVSMRVHTRPGFHSSRSPRTKMHNGPRAIGFVSQKQTTLPYSCPCVFIRGRFTLHGAHAQKCDHPCPIRVHACSYAARFSLFEEPTHKNAQRPLGQLALFRKNRPPLPYCVSMRVHSWPVHSSRSPCTKMHNGPWAIWLCFAKQTPVPYSCSRVFIRGPVFTLRGALVSDPEQLPALREATMPKRQSAEKV